MSTDKSSRTEAPTQRRRDDARNKGDIASSHDLTVGLALFVASLALFYAGKAIGSELMLMMKLSLGSLRAMDIDHAFVIALAESSLRQLVSATALLIGASAAANAGASALQAGLHVSFQPLSPDIGRLDPIKGFGRIFSSAAVMRGIQGTLKITVLSVILVVSFWHQRNLFASIGEGTLAAAIEQSWEIIVQAFFTISIAMVIMGISDFAFQKWRFESQLKMSREELRQERKEDEGDPLMRARIKRVQRELSNQRMLRDVPKATVVITNPTHYAVALQYESNSMDAPKVVAKGVDEMAKRIRRLAEENGVPILERKPLARALYKTADVGDDIPADLYHAVAEIVAYLYRLGRLK